MQEQEKHKSSGMKATMHEQKKQKSSSMPEQGKGISLLDEAKNSMRHTKNARVVFTSDAERNLDGERYRLGDMVWAKVKSHPWWPGQLYDPKLASASALELKRDSCFLVAFFGDSTFGWFAEAELIPFAPNFAQKSKQTSAHNFVDAVEDALDEVRRRVKVGLTCSCCISDSTSDDERKPGLLYDRQLRDIRRTFKPAGLFALIRELACSPFSSSQNMLGSTIARAQADAFRLLVSSKKTSEHGRTQVLGDLVLSSQMKAQAPYDARISETSKDKYKVEKGIKRKQLSLVQGISQEQKDLNPITSTNEKLGGLDKTGGAKKHSTGSSTKKGSTEKSKGLEAEEGGGKGTSSKSESFKPAEDGRTIDATVSYGISASMDALKETDLGGSGQDATLPETYKTSTVLDEGIQNDPSLVVRDSLAKNQVKATQMKTKKSLQGPVNKKISKVPKADATELQISSTKPKAAIMNVKSTNVDVGQLSKIKAVKKAKAVNVELEEVVKNVKGANADVEQVSKAKRMAELDTTEGGDVFPVKVKKRKVTSEIVSNNYSDRSLNEDVVGSLASDGKMQQQIEEVMSDSTGLESDFQQSHVESFILMEAIEDVSATCTLEVNRLQPAEALQSTREDKDALAPVVAGPQVLKQGDGLEAGHPASSGLPAKSSADVSKKRKKKPKDSNNIEASVALVPLKQGEQLELEHNAISCVQVEDSTDIAPKKKKKPKDMSSVQPLKPLGDDALVSPVERLKEGDTLGKEHTVESSHQVNSCMDISKKKKKSKDTKIVELPSNEGNTTYLSKGDDGKENAKSMETFSKVMENEISEAVYSSPLDVDSRLMDSGGTGSSFVSCGAVDALKDISQKKKEMPAVKSGQKAKKVIKSLKEVKESKSLPSFNKVIVSNKRVFEEKEHLHKDSRERSKKFKTGIMESAPQHSEFFQGEDGGEQHEDPTNDGKESTQSQDLHEGFLPVAAKPPGFSKEEIFSAAQTDLTNSRKAVYQAPEDLLLSVKYANTGIPEASNTTGWESSKTSESAREQTELSFERGDHSFKAERSKAEDVKTEKEGVQEVLEGGKQSGEDDIAAASKLLKKSVSISKKVSSSSISLRPAIDVKTPVRGSKEILNRFGQRVPRQSDEAERLGSHPCRTKSVTVEGAFMISFPQGCPLPSEIELMEVFAKFGDLNLPLTRVDSRSGCARLVFRRTQDAEAALRCMKENPVYEKARFWLKPRDADVGELSKQSSKYSSSSERPALSRSNKLEAKTVSDTLGSMSAFDKRMSLSTENDIASDRHIRYGNRVPQNSTIRKADVFVKGGVVDAQPSLIANPSEKLSTGNLNAGHESLEGIVTNCSNAAASSSHIPSVAPGPMDMPSNVDISEPFLALLHQLHDLVLSIGFNF